MSELFKKGFLPIAALIMVLIITNVIYMVDGNIDLIRLWMCVGISFGMVKVRTILVPFSLNLVVVPGSFLLYFAVGGFFGGFIAIFTIIQAVLFIVNYMIHGVTQIHVSC